MNRKMLLLLIFLLKITMGHSQQYIWVNIGDRLPDTQSAASLSDIAVKGDSIWICSGLGDEFNHIAGEIYFSSDGGDTFSIQSTLYGTNSIFMLDSKRGYCGGSEGQMYKTTNGGGEWIRIGSIGQTIIEITFPPNSDTGYVCGYTGKIYRITPSGLQSMSSGTSNNMQGISAPSKNNIFSAWWQSVLFSDGTTWTDQESSFQVQTGLGVYITAIDMVTDSVGWIAGINGLVCKTESGGWNSSERNGWIQQPCMDNDWGAMKIRFSDLNCGIVAGTQGHFAKTTDGGNTWVHQAEGLTQNMLTSVFIDGEYRAFVVGNNRTLLHYMQSSDVADNLMNEILCVSPNPTSGTVQINLQRDETVNRIEVSDIHGKQILHVDRPIVKTIDLSGFENGIYFLKLQTSGYTYVRKIIKK